MYIFNELNALPVLAGPELTAALQAAATRAETPLALVVRAKTAPWFARSIKVQCAF
jgi:hypothetical protein